MNFTLAGATLTKPIGEFQSGDMVSVRLDTRTKLITITSDNELAGGDGKTSTPVRQRCAGEKRPLEDRTDILNSVSGGELTRNGVKMDGTPVRVLLDLRDQMSKKPKAARRLL